MLSNQIHRISFTWIFCFCIVQNVFSQSNNTVHNPLQSFQVSNLNIKAFCQDPLGYMWIATPNGLNRYNGYEYVQYYNDANDSNSVNSDFVRTLFLDSSDRLWIGTPSGVDLYDFESDHFIHFRGTESELSHNIFSFFEDHHKNVWAVAAPGAFIIDTIGRQLNLFPSTAGKYINQLWEDNCQRLWMGLDENPGLAVQLNEGDWNYFSLPEERKVRCKYEDQQGSWWLGTEQGIVIFDPKQKRFEDTPISIKKNGLLSHAQINFIKDISPLKLIIGTDSQGLFLYDIFSQTLSQQELNPRTAIRSSQLLSCFVDKDENVWIGSFDRGFTVWNRSLDHFNSDQSLSDIFKDKFVNQIAEDKEGGLWVATRYDGLHCYSVSGKHTVYTAHNSDLFPNDEELIESLCIDSHGRLWMGLTNYLVIARILPDGRLQKVAEKNFKWVGFMKEDLMGNLWLCSMHGLYRIKVEEPSLEPELITEGGITNICPLESGKLLFSSYGDNTYIIDPVDFTTKPFINENEENQRVSGACIALFEDSKNRVWMGSYGAGLLCISADGRHYRAFDKKQGLPSNDALSFEEDDEGNIWISTSFGLSMLRQSDTTFVNYFSSDGTLGNQYHEKVALKHSDGRIFFAGNHGLTFFDPKTDMPNRLPPRIHLTDLKIFNKSVEPSTGSVISHALPFVKKIVLNHNQTLISIDYSGIDYLFPNKLKYVYMLEGFDKSWNYVGSFRRASYSNLKPGTYNFKVKAINGEGIESQTPATLEISVKSAPWFSNGAWASYIVLFLALVYFIFKLALRTRINKHNLETEHQEREREAQIAKMKMNFYADISHELRTPLTLISAPLEKLMKTVSVDQQSRHLLNTISRNVQSMLRLINQLLDFNRLEEGMLSLKVQQIDVIAFVRRVEEIFYHSATAKQISWSFSPHKPVLQLWIDPDIIEKVLYNLLSNAVKFTPGKGKIEIVTRELSEQDALLQYSFGNQTYLEIVVIDNGPGVPQDKIQDLFIRYKQVKGPGGMKPDYSGSGIGLHYTKRLIETHLGAIKADVRPEGGMIFSFILPLEDVYTHDKKISSSEKSDQDIPPLISLSKKGKAFQPEKHHTILVAEDNVELLDFIRDLLEEKYRVITALDGDNAWRLVQKECPDLIVSDILMPGLSGYELCEKVKKTQQFSHIPVVLLTAKSTFEEQLKGLEEGANAYICKPFNIDYLLLTIKNLLAVRDQLRSYFSSPQLRSINPAGNSVKLTAIDQRFMDKLIQMLENELANPELNINHIARELGYSRTGFYRKIRGLCGISPSDFFRTYRLKRAAEMIHEGSFSLADIATNTGFNFYPHFSKLFKKQFGVSPKDYKGN
ncbi:hybrid sensor histidine kinase/response regulator transcription factor [Maribellus sp. YY47]|uniref:hybrid sensor histidine kinase/response regulator transcription factor n=1 Tax=Maribellus sp. YY47 TaxID=2929486 RepID=UPI002001457F|nr:hybrid sensor histidine kinase/response regulator transcription factor [Maribellus sp. YY47]MCK3684388.1 response regulator [Maribellus sp. YY47]